MRTRSASAALLTTGALGIAVTTALEVVTAPYSPAVLAYSLNGAVHLVKIAAAVVLVAGLLRLLTELRRRGERMAAAAADALAAATALGAVPYSAVEAFLGSGLSPAAADARLSEVYDQHTWIGTTASIALPLILMAVVTLAVVALRHRLTPAWAPVVSLISIPVAVLAGVLGEAGWAVPHPPAWIFLGLAAYGPALLQADGTPTPHRVREAA